MPRTHASAGVGDGRIVQRVCARLDPGGMPRQRPAAAVLLGRRADVGGARGGGQRVARGGGHRRRDGGGSEEEEKEERKAEASEPWMHCGDGRKGW